MGKLFLVPLQTMSSNVSTHILKIYPLIIACSELLQAIAAYPAVSQLDRRIVGILASNLQKGMCYDHCCQMHGRIAWWWMHDQLLEHALQSSPLFSCSV